MVNAAKAVMDSKDVLDYCIQNFGRGLDINVGAYAQGIPSEDDSPFLWIQPKEENEAVNSDSVFQVRFTIGGCVKGPEGQKILADIVAERSDRSNGLVVNGGNAIVEGLRDLVMKVVRDAKAGSRVVAMRRVENDISHFPLEWAEFFVDYVEDVSLANSMI